MSDLVRFVEVTAVSWSYAALSAAVLSSGIARMAVRRVLRRAESGPQSALAQAQKADEASAIGTQPLDAEQLEPVLLSVRGSRDERGVHLTLASARDRHLDDGDRADAEHLRCPDGRPDSLTVPEELDFHCSPFTKSLNTLVPKDRGDRQPRAKVHGPAVSEPYTSDGESSDQRAQPRLGCAHGGGG